MRAYRHLLPAKEFEQEREGYNAMTMTNVPAFKEEPDMPPENTVQPWLMVYYSGNDKEPEQFWKDQGKEQQRILKENAKANGDIKKAAAEVV